MNRNITALILLILAGGIYYTFTKGQLDQARAVKAVNAQYASALDNANELIKVRDQVLQRYHSISDLDRDRLDKMIPSTVDNIRLIVDLNNIAAKRGISLKNIKASAAGSDQNGPSGVATVPAPGAPSPTGGISEPKLDTVTVTFSVEAPYLEFIGFLQDIEANLRIMDVTKLSLTTADSGVYDFNVELKTYWIRQ